MRVRRSGSTSSGGAARATVVVGGLLALVAVATACGGTGGMPTPSTTQGDEVVSLWQTFLYLAIAVTLLIWGLTTWVIVTSLRRRRAAKRAGTEDLPVQHQYHNKLEYAYTIAPFLLVIVLLALSFKANDITTNTSTPAQLSVTVVGFQWQWQFAYDNNTIVVAGDPEHPPVLMLPVGRTVRFTLVSTDVIHSFWVPEFLEKRDLVPGVDPPNQIEVYVKQTGTWVGRCAEYCGFNHWEMQFQVQAVPADEFDRWYTATSARPQPQVQGGRQVGSTTSSTAVPITTPPPTVTNPPISLPNGSTVTPGTTRARS